MKYTLKDGKEIRIPDKQILHLMTTMHIKAEEAVQIYLEDEGILHNQEQEDLCKKVQDSGIMRTIHDAKAIKTTEKKTYEKKTQKERVKKENPTKAMIIAKIAELLPEFAENIDIVNPEKIIEFSVGDLNFKLDLIKHNKKS